MGESNWKSFQRRLLDLVTSSGTGRTRSSLAAKLPAERKRKAAPLSKSPLLIQSNKPLPWPVKEPKALYFIPGSRTSGHSEKVRSSLGDKPSKSYSKAEVSQHNKRTDCWIIIKDKVYDVTPYVEEHPGGDAILDHAGTTRPKGFLGHSMQPESST